MDFLLSLVVQSSMSTTQAESLVGPIAMILCGVFAGFVAWQLTDRLIAWRQDTD